MQPLFSVGGIVKSPKMESADSQIRENHGHVPAHKNSGACPGQKCFVGAKQVHCARHEAVGETSAASPIDENSKVLGRTGLSRMACIACSNSVNVYGSVSISSALGRSGTTTHVTGMRHLYP